MKGMAATYQGPRAGRVDFRGRARALARATRKFGALGTSGDSVEPRPWAVRVKPDSDKELLEELRKALTWMKALEGGQVDRTPKQASIAGSDIKEPRRIPRKRHGSATLRRRAVAVLALSLLIAVSAGWVLFQKGAVQKNPFDTSRPRLRVLLRLPSGEAPRAIHPALGRTLGRRLQLQPEITAHGVGRGQSRQRPRRGHPMGHRGSPQGVHHGGQRWTLSHGTGPLRRARGSPCGPNLGRSRPCVRAEQTAKGLVELRVRQLDEPVRAVLRRGEWNP